MTMGEQGHRASFRRTTSVVMIGVDVEEASLFPQPEYRPPAIVIDRRPMAAFSPTFDAKRSGDSEVPADHFLKRCDLCRRSLAPDIDVYMYRGDSAFCSVECREQRMKQDERRERRAAAKNVVGGQRHEVVAAAADTSDKGKTAVAA